MGSSSLGRRAKVSADEHFTLSIDTGSHHRAHSVYITAWLPTSNATTSCTTHQATRNNRDMSSDCFIIQVVEVKQAYKGLRLRNAGTRYR